MTAEAGRRPRWPSSTAVLLLALAVWGLAPLLAVAIHALRHHEVLTGADGLVPADQLQYLAWMRDAGVHGLAGNLFTIPAGGRVYLQPVFTLSGLLWKVGVPLSVAWWLWAPVAVVALFAGAFAWVGRFLTERWSRGLALLLALFLFAPAGEFAAWLSGSFGTSHDALLQLSAEMFAAGELWGYLPAALAIALMAVALLAAERAAGGGAWRALITAALAGAGAAWLHPWQGVTLALILAALVAWGGGGLVEPGAGRGGRGRGRAALGVILLATCLPLAYYGLLSRYDPSWRVASHNEVVPHAPLGTLLLVLGPVLAAAAFGLRRPVTLAERALLLWVPAALLTYALLGSYPTHALEGVSLPVAVLLARAGRRRLTFLGMSRRTRRLLAGLATVAVTLPGALYLARTLRTVVRSDSVQVYLTRDDARALRYVVGSSRPGGVLARTLFAVGVPARTGRTVWVGHQFWSRDYVQRSAVADQLVAGVLSPAATRELVRRSGVGFVLVDCGVTDRLAGSLAPLTPRRRRFGCATVYELRKGGG